MSSTGHLPELDMLRGQVADLSRELAERDRVAQDLREQSGLLRAIVKGTAAETGEEFFSALVTQLTSTLHIKYAIIGEVQGDRIKKIRTLAVSAGGVLADNFEYELAHTPCAIALTQTFACFDRDLQALFPQFQRLADLGAESYCGVPLWTKGGAVIGLLVMMDTKPLEQSDDLQALLGVFAPRIAAEFERRRAEQESAQALANLDNVIESIPDIVFALNTQGNLVKWNRRLRDVTGYSHEELLNKPALAFVPPEEQTSTAAAIQRAFMEGYAELEGHLLTKDHRLIPYHWTGALLKNLQGEPIGITGIGRDVSDKKLAEEALHRSEEHLALAVEGSNDILWDAQRLPGEPWYAPQTPIWWSLRVRELLGLQESDLFETLEQWVARLHPDDKDHVFGQLAAHIEQRVPYDVEYRLRTNAGDYRWIRGRGQALWDEQGEPRRMSGSCQDITDRKQVEESLLQNRAFLQSFVEHTPAAVAMLDRDLKYVAVSRRWYQDYRLVNRDIIGLHHYDVFPEIRKIEHWQVIHRRCLAGEIIKCDEDRFCREDGREDWLRWEVRPWVNESGSVGGIIMFTEVITERKQTEEALRKSEERYARATAVGKVGVWELDVARGTYHGDLNLKGLFGYLDDELSTDPYVWLNLVHRDDQSIAMDRWQRIVNGERDDYNYELRMFKKDGTVIWTDIRGHAVRDHEGQVTQVFGTTVDITERKQAQDALALSERQLRTVLDALPMGVWFTDRSGKTLLANPAAKQIWSNIKQIGLQTENNQTGWWETIGPANEPHRWALSHVLTTGVPSQNETFDFECLDGMKKTIRNSTVPVKNEDGVILGAIVLNEDITALRQAQAALQLTQFSVDHAVEGFLWIGPDARIFHVNDSICQMLEYTWEGLTAMTLHDIDPNLSAELWSAHWEELRQKGSLTFESKYWSRTGRVLDMEVTVNYLPYEGKEYNCAIMRDIGERKRTEEALRASEERYRVLYDETPTMYFKLASDGRVLSVNRFGAEQLGYQTEELIGHSVLGLFHEDDKEAVAANLSECLATPEITRYWEFRKLRKDRSIIWVRETARVTQSSTEEPVVLVTCEDITAHKRAEHESRERIRQAMAMQTALLELVHLDDTGLTFSEVLPQVTRIVADMLAVERVSLWLLSEDQTELVCQNLWLRGQATHSAGYRLAASRYPHYCAVLKESLVVAASDARVDQRTSEFTDDYFTSLGITSVLDVPIHCQGKLLGVLWCEHVGAPREWTHEAQDFAASVGQTIMRMMEAAERKRAEKELRKSHAFIRQIIDTDPNFIFAKDREGRFTLVNKAVADAYGTTVENLIGKTDADFNPNQEEVMFFRQDDLAVIDTLHELFLPEEVITDSDGRTRWLQTVKRPILDDEGCAIMVLGSSTDITERKRIEETLRQRERDLQAALQERERISQDLHDGILQSLFAVGLALESAKLTMPPRNLKVSRASLNQAIDQLNDVMREIRNFIAGMGSDLLQGKDFPAALKQMLASLTEHQATRVLLAVEDRAAKALSTEQSLHLIRVIQEAVSNCVKHGHAQEARVSLKMLKRGVRLRVRDNGRGFNQGAAKRTGHGLANMAARARQIGGRFTILSKVNEGTSIVLDFPKKAADVSR